MSRQCSRCKEMKDYFPHKKSYCRQCGIKDKLKEIRNYTQNLFPLSQGIY